MNSLHDIAYTGCFSAFPKQVSSGVPLCLGWEHIGQRRQNLLLYEELRGVRRKRNAMILSARTRANL